MPGGILSKLRIMFEGDPGVRKVAGDPALTAELLLLFRMMLADGKIADRELQVFRRICRETFGIGEDSLDGVIRYLQDFGYETTAPQALDMFRALPIERRQVLVRNMADIAKADETLNRQEIGLLTRTVEFLGVDPRDVLGEGN